MNVIDLFYALVSIGNGLVGFLLGLVVVILLKRKRNKNWRV